MLYCYHRIDYVMKLRTSYLFFIFVSVIKKLKIKKTRIKNIIFIQGVTRLIIVSRNNNYYYYYYYYYLYSVKAISDYV